MVPPKLRVRLAALLLLLVLLVVYLVVALVATPAAVYLCDALGSDGPVQCGGLEDKASCAAAGLPNATACVRSSCGFRLAPKLDISVSGGADPLRPAEPTDAAHVLMVVSSVVPYALGVVLLACQIFAGDTFSLLCMGLLLALIVLNELLLKRQIEQRRPVGSCLYFASYGMPSGHACTSIGTLTFLLLETWVDRPKWSRRRQGATTAALLLALGSVPYSRVHLNDHTPAQVAAGAAEGFVVASLYFLCAYRYMRPRLDDWLRSVPLRLRNTYRTDQPWVPDWRPETVEQEQEEEEAERAQNPVAVD